MCCRLLERVLITLLINDCPLTAAWVNSVINTRSSSARSGLSSGDVLAEACGDRFVSGIVLYDHAKVVPFGERLCAVPISALWR